MQKDILRHIWDIRGLVDKAINHHDVELYKKAKQQFLKLKESGMIFKTIASQTLSAEYETEEQRNFDIECNYVMLLYNLKELKKDVIGEEREEQELQFSSVMEILWYTRAMYDSFILNAELKCVEEDENKKLYFMIEENLKSFLGFYGCFAGATVTKEKITIIEILRELDDTFNKYYKNKLTTIE